MRELRERIRTNYVTNAERRITDRAIGASPIPNYPERRRYGGAPFQAWKPTRVAIITDGLSNTLMMSEILVLPEISNQGDGTGQDHTLTRTPPWEDKFLRAHLRLPPVAKYLAS